MAGALVLITYVNGFNPGPARMPGLSISSAESNAGVTKMAARVNALVASSRQGSYFTKNSAIGRIIGFQGREPEQCARNHHVYAPYPSAEGITKARRQPNADNVNSFRLADQIFFCAADCPFASLRLRLSEFEERNRSYDGRCTPC